MNTLAPSLRFSNFTKSWEIISIGSLLKLKIIDKPMDGNHGNIHPKASDYVDSGIPFVMSNNIVNGKLNYAGMKYIPKPLADNLQKGFAQKGDVLLTHKGTIGATTLVEEIQTPYIMLTPQVTYYRVTDPSKLDNKYLLQAFRSSKFQSLIKRLSASGTRPYIGITEQRELWISKPTLQEQQKIADFLTVVDTKINQLTEKHRLLKEYKKGVMQQIFSQQLRFKDKDGKTFPEWKSYPLKKVLFLQSDTLNMLDDETYELITIKRGFGGVVSRGLFKGKDVLVKNQFTIHENEFVISKRQIVHGACGLVPAALNGAIVSNEYNVFRPVEHLLDIDYFNRFTTTPLMRRAFFINSDGVHIEKLLFKTQSWLKTKVTLPCLEEQQKIAHFLQALDSKITAVSEQIEQTKQFKKGLLQQMFV
ncbi:restriction endonuclease subunit S [Vibrio cholerae]|nr:restriction endonuclease subunit S [Vibrio cholerae]ELJ8519847.1 restriction endonuclease subunit S [Vibrio cholerae]